VCDGCGCARFIVESVPPLRSATSGCSCVRSYKMFWNLWLLMLQNALSWLHECCMWLVGEEAGARNRAFFRVKWLRPVMNIPRAHGGCGCDRFNVESILPWCSATCGCSCVRTSLRLLNLWQQIDVNGCMIVAMFCCHVRREMRISHLMLQNAL